MANFGLIGNAANDYIKGTPSHGIISDTITGRDNGKGAVYNAIDDYVKTPNTSTFDKDKFAKSLLGGMSSMSGTSSQPQYKVNPSMVNYSEYMGLSPETQRYLYGGM